MESKRIFSKTYQDISIDELIAQPLISIAKANALLASQQAKFLLETCFIEKEDRFAPIMLNMTLTRGIIDHNPNDVDKDLQIKSVPINFSVPLITLIPLNSIAIQSFDLGFEIELKNQFKKNNQPNKRQKEQKEQKNKSIDTISIRTPYDKVSLEGVISYDSKERQANTNNDASKYSNHSKLNYNIKAGTIPLPEGVKILINAFSKGIEPT